MEKHASFVYQQSARSLAGSHVSNLMTRLPACVSAEFACKGKEGMGKGEVRLARSLSTSHRIECMLSHVSAVVK